MKKNTKGFTLIELLAVVVILALLIAVAVPAVTKYLSTARQGSLRNEASTLIETTRTYLVAENITNDGTMTFTIGNREASWTATGGSAQEPVVLLQKNLSKSPYGNTYTAAKVTVTGGVYSICLTDGTNGISATEDAVQDKTTSLNTTTCS